MSTTTTVIDIVAQVTDETDRGTRSSTANISKIEKAVQQMQTAVNRMQNQSRVEVIASLRDYATRGISSVLSAGKNLAGNVWSVTLKALDYATAPIRGLMELVKNPITQMVAITGVSMGVSDTVNTFADYEQSLANTRAVTGASDEEMSQIAEMVKGYGASTAFSAAEVGAASTVLGTAGWNAESITGGMGGILNLASAGDVSIDTAADITTSTLAQWGKDASQSTQVADVLAKTAASSKTDVAGLGETFKYAGSMANALEYSLEDTAIAVGLMGNAGVDGSSAGTSLRTMLTNLIDPTTDTKTSMDKLGISLTDQNGEMKSLMDVMGDLRTGFTGLSADEKTFYASSIAGAEGLSGLLAIVNAAPEDFETLTNSIYGAAGSAQEMADIRMDSLSGDILALSSAADGVKIAIGERLQPMLRSFIQWVTAKLPDVSTAFNAAFDWLDNKKASIMDDIGALVWSIEYQEAGTTWEKMKVSWQQLVADPFDEWWSGGGEAFCASIAGKMGSTMGSVLSGGLLALFGIDATDATNEGAVIATAFVEGFKANFDLESVWAGFQTFAKNIAKDAGTLLPGGEEASSTSLLSAGLVGMGAAKVGGAVAGAVNGGSALYKGGKALVQGAGTVATKVFPKVTDFTSGLRFTLAANSANATAATQSAAGFAQSGALGRAGQMGAATGSAAIKATGAVTKGATFAASTGGKFISTVGGKALGVLGLGLEAADGASRAKEWTGSNDAESKMASGLGAMIGGTGDGILGEKSVFGKILDVGAGALKGAAAGGAVGTAFAGIGAVPGAIGGAVAGGAAAMVGGENFAQVFNSEKFRESVYTYFDNLDQAWTTFWGGVGTFFTSTVPQALGTIGASVTNFFTVSVPEFFENLITGAVTFFTESVPFALGYAGGKITAFFTVTIPGKWDELIDGATAFFTETLPQGLEMVGSSVTNFFTVSVPGFFGTLWSGAVEFCTVSVPEALAVIGEGITEFFTVNVPDFFKGMWESGVMMFTETIPQGLETIAEGITQFFTVTVPDFVQGLWDSAIESFFDPIAQAKEAISSSVSGFFESAKNKVSNFFSDAIESASSFFSSGFSAGSGSVPAYAEGGILTKPHVGLVAEDGAEAIIPLSGKRRARGLELWEQAGKLLGVKPYAEGGIVGETELFTDETEQLPGISVDASSANHTRGGVHVPVTIQNITFQVTASDNGTSEEGLVTIIKENVENLTDEIAARLAAALKQVFSNMPVATEG